MLQKALFLDRDGVINIDHGYVYKVEDFEFTEGIFELLHLFMEEGYSLFIVTNQSGIGRDYYSEDNFKILTDWMLIEFKKQRIIIESVEYCPHAPELNCACRKPATGMIDNILKKYEIDLENSWIIGDKQSDIDLAKNAHIVQTVAVGERIILNASYSFKTIVDFKLFIEKNREIIKG